MKQGRQALQFIKHHQWTYICHLKIANLEAKAPEMYGHARIWPNRIWPKPHLTNFGVKADFGNPILAIVCGQPILANPCLANPSFWCVVVVGGCVQGLSSAGPPPPPDRPKIRSFVSLSHQNFYSFLPLLLVLCVEYWWCF